MKKNDELLDELTKAKKITMEEILQLCKKERSNPNLSYYTKTFINGICRDNKDLKIEVGKFVKNIEFSYFPYEYGVVVPTNEFYINHGNKILESNNGKFEFISFIEEVCLSKESIPVKLINGEYKKYYYNLLEIIELNKEIQLLNKEKHEKIAKINSEYNNIILKLKKLK